MFENVRRSLSNVAVATSDAGMPRMGHIFIHVHAMGGSRNLMTALMGSSLAPGNAAAITSYDLRVAKHAFGT